MAPLNRGIIACMLAVQPNGLDTGKVLEAIKNSPPFDQCVALICGDMIDNDDDAEHFTMFAASIVAEQQGQTDDVIRVLNFEVVALYDELEAMVKGN